MPLKCPKCGASWVDIDVKSEDIIWKSNGRKCKIGEKMVEAVDPIWQKATCRNCGIVFVPSDIDRERVEFT